MWGAEGAEPPPAASGLQARSRWGMRVCLVPSGAALGWGGLGCASADRAHQDPLARRGPAGGMPGQGLRAGML